MKLFRKINNQGFAHPEFILVALVLLAVVGTGYYVFRDKTGGFLSSLAEKSSLSNKNKATATNSESKATAEQRNYTFELRKDDQKVREYGIVSGPVTVGINMNTDENLTNIRFYVDGVEKGSKQGIGLKGFREFYTWHTKFDTNGEHTISVKAVGPAGNEFEVKSSITDGKSMPVVVDNGSDSRAPAGSGTGGGTSSDPSASAYTIQPRLTIGVGPLEGVAGSQPGSVNGSQVTGGIVFAVTFKRPKSEVYDLKTMNVQLVKDGLPRINMNDKSYGIEVHEVGDYNVYNFKRYYGTQNKPNGSSTWVAVFTPNVPSPDSDKVSDPVVVDIENPDSNAEATCRDLKNEVNDLFERMNEKLDNNQQRIVEVNRRIDERYTALDLSNTNPIPGYDAKKSSIAEMNGRIDSLQSELADINIQCRDTDGNVEDAGAKVAAFKVKLEEAKGAVGAMNAATLDLLGELRTRVRQR